MKNLGPGRHCDGGGLFLFVRSAESAFWVFRYTRQGKMREMGLGRARGKEAVPLAKARDKAIDLRRLLEAGVDPLAEKAAKAEAEQAEAAANSRAAVTFRQEAEAYITAHAPGWRNSKHVAQWRSTLAMYCYPRIGDLPVGAITTDHVLGVPQPIWEAKPETASRLRGRIESILIAATVKGLRPPGQNPAAWKGHLDQLFASRMKIAPIEHHPALPYAELPAFFLRLQAADGMGARALELAILTAGRTGEILGATWLEIDLEAEAPVWIIPAVRMKARREHRVPLSPPAVTLLRRLATLREGDFVFAGRREKTALSNMAMLMCLRRLDREDLTAHGFRSTFRDWAAETTGFPSEVVEMALAHAVGDKVEAAYRRGDLFQKRRELMEAWSTYCTMPRPARSTWAPQ
jgi:integrase